MESGSAERVAERELVGIDEGGVEERVVVWLELRPGLLWTVCRAVNPHFRDNGHTRAEDVVYETYELDDALEHVNEMLEDEVSVIEEDGREQVVRPITRREVEPVLERRFFA